MKNTLKLCTASSLSLFCLLPFASHAQQQELARVVSSTPVMQQVAVPQQVCSDSQVWVQPPKSGAGAAMGAIAGGAIGSQIGGGTGKALAIGAGVIGGAVLGDRIEGQPAGYAQPVTSCGTQTRYENRVTAYNVVYEYAGRQYSVQTATPPGDWIPINVMPAMGASAPPPVVVSQPVITTYPTVVYPAPYYYGPSYGSGVSVRYGHGPGWGGHGHGRGHGHGHGHGRGHGHGHGHGHGNGHGHGHGR